MLRAVVLALVVVVALVLVGELAFYLCTPVRNRPSRLARFMAGVRRGARW